MNRPYTSFALTCVYKYMNSINIIANFPFIGSNIPTAPAYEVYISQLINYCRAPGQYSHFVERAQLPTKKIRQQLGYDAPVIKSLLQKFYGRHKVDDL